MAAHLGEVDFPPYVVKCVDETHFLVAGGGGQARTGVPNAIVSFMCSSISLFRCSSL